MRRTVAALLFIGLFTLSSSVAVGATRQSITIKAVVAQAGWETFDENTGAGEFGVVEFATAERRTTVALVVSTGELIQCEGASTPDDPTDDMYGFVGSETQGEGPARLSVGKSYRSAVASGTVTAHVTTVNECTGGSAVTTTTTIRIALELTAIGPIIVQKSRTTIAIPRQLRSKTFIQSSARNAAGSLSVGARSIEAGGVIGTLSLRASQVQR